MHPLRVRRSRPVAGAGVALLAAVVAGCGGSGESISDHPIFQQCPPPRLAVLGAFPAELGALVERATIDETIVEGDRTYRVGTLGGVPVVLGMTGIGLVNAVQTTNEVLTKFDVDGVVISGVAGSFHRIGDVAVPLTWRLSDGTTYTPKPEWIGLADELTGVGTVEMQRCTEVPPNVSPDIVCLDFDPEVFVGGVGRSSDPYGNSALDCQPGAGDVFGCDIVAETSFSANDGGFTSHPAADEPIASGDMETAGIAAEAERHGLPFIGFRAVSDGAGDPLGLPGFPSQFFAYYRLAANNAAAAVTGFLERLAASNSCEG